MVNQTHTSGPTDTTEATAAGRGRSADREPVLPHRPALVHGRVLHQRTRPARHRFETTLTQVWVDPDRPEELTDRSRWWSTDRVAPGRFRRRDYLDGGTGPLGDEIRRALTDAIGDRPTGPLRTLTQPRVWGWLFNPLTIHLAWNDPGTDPVAALLEVTNTPWKERHCYPVALVPGERGLEARFAKVLHVSPFLDQAHTYRFGLRPVDPTGPGPALEFALDVTPDPADPADSAEPADPEGPILVTRLRVDLDPGADARAMRSVLRPDRLPTHRVSAGIHRQALSLWRKGVPFVPHPRKRQ